MDDELHSFGFGLVAELRQGVAAKVHADRVRRPQVQRVGPAAADGRHGDGDRRLEPARGAKQIANRVVGDKREVTRQQQHSVRPLGDSTREATFRGHVLPLLARLQKALARMAECVERHDPGPWFRAHVSFHEEIVRAAANRPLGRLASVVRLSIRRFHPLLLKTERRLDDAYREHRAIFDAIAARDAAGAERLARAHIAGAKAIVLTLMAQGEGHAAVQA